MAKVSKISTGEKPGKGVTAVPTAASTSDSTATTRCLPAQIATILLLQNATNQAISLP